MKRMISSLWRLTASSYQTRNSLGFISAIRCALEHSDGDYDGRSADFAASVLRRHYATFPAWKWKQFDARLSKLNRRYWKRHFEASRAFWGPQERRAGGWSWKWSTAYVRDQEELPTPSELDHLPGLQGGAGNYLVPSVIRTWVLDSEPNHVGMGLQRWIKAWNETSSRTMLERRREVPSVAVSLPPELWPWLLYLSPTRYHDRHSTALHCFTHGC